jgi:hypothetical protein
MQEPVCIDEDDNHDNPQGLSKSRITLCCAPWNSNTDDWWIHHPTFVIAFENDTHTCYHETNHTEQALFWQHVYHLQWNKSLCHATYNLATNESLLLQKTQISSGYAAALQSVARSLYASVRLGRPMQLTRHHAHARWNFAVAAAASNATTTHWAECPTQDFLPLSPCAVEIGVDSAPTGTKPSTARRQAEFRWLRQWAFRPRQHVRYHFYQYYHQQYQSHLLHLGPLSEQQQHVDPIAPTVQKWELRPNQLVVPPCTAIHVRRTDIAFGRGRRYVAVADYVRAGRIPPKSTIVVLTDDASTLDEIQDDCNIHASQRRLDVHTDKNNHPFDRNATIHTTTTTTTADYHWMVWHRPRFRGTQGGFEGFVPSMDPALEVLAIWADVALTAHCHTLIHGKSGFVTLLTDALAASGHAYHLVYVSEQAQSKAHQAKMDPAERARLYWERIRQQYHTNMTLETTTTVASKGNGRHEKT